jgi:PAS domain S-box-containing protein
MTVGHDGKAPRRRRWLVPAAIAGALTVGAGAGIQVWAAREQAQALEHWQGRLEAMAVDRQAAIESWVRERLGHARTIAAYPTTVYLAEGRKGPPYPFPVSEGPRGHLSRLLVAARDLYGYDGAWLLGSGPRRPVLAGTGTAPPMGGLVERVEAGGEPEVELRPGPGPTLLVAAPVSAPGRAAGRPIGVVLLSLDPRPTLFAPLRREPVPTRTGESLLVRREGGEIVFLTPPRHGLEGLRQPVGTERRAAATALEGREVFGEFTDYRGARVLASVRPIPGTAWGLVVKIDRQEALKDATDELVRTATAVLGLLLAVLGVGFGVWGQQTAAARTALARSEARFGLMLENAADAVLFVRPDGSIVKANRRAEELYGCSRTEIEGLRIHDLYPPEQAPAIEARLKAVRGGSALVFEAEQRGRDGTPIPVEVSSRFVELDGEGLYLSIVRDARERKASERRIAVLNRTLRVLSEINQLIVREPDRERFLDEACRILVENGGFRLAWVGFRDPQTDWILPLAWAGHEEGYLGRTFFSASDAIPRGQGPAGAAVREGRAVVADVESDESLGPWREAALERGYRALCASPIRVNGVVSGVLALYSEQPGVFVPQVVQLIEGLAADVGFAVEGAEARQEREDAAAALARSKAFLEALVDSASVAIYTLRPDGRVGDIWNAASHQLFGWSAGEVMGGPAPFVPSDREDEARGLRELVLRGQHLTNVEVRCVRRDGTPVDLSLAASPLRDADGQVVSILVMAADITERKRAEEALRESEDRFKRLAENAPDVIYRHRLWPSPRTEYVSPGVHAVIGYSPDDFYADPALIFKVIHPEDQHLVAKAARGEIPSGKAVVVRWRKRDGSALWTEIRNVLVRDEQGRVVAFEGISRDITERVQAERAVRSLSAAVEQTPVAIVITDAEGTIEYVNPAFSHQSGYSREEALGKNPRILKSGHHPPEFYAGLYATIARGGEWRGEILNRKKSGELYWENATISAIVDEAGRPRRYLAVKEDITRRKAAEEDLRRTQEQLTQSQKLEAVGRLAGGVAHDFNNLLGVIIGHGQLAQSSIPEGHPARARVEQILGSAARAAELTRQLLAFSRRQVLQPRVLDLNAEVADTEKMLRRLIGEDVDLVTRPDPGIGRVRADRGQISQVLMNLAVNARDAMPRGGVLTIETSNLDANETFVRDHVPMPPGRYVQLRVADDGAGMEESVREHVFEPFFTTKPEGQGSGLGLSTVYGIVKQSGGFIWADSAPGRGTTFTIHLPRVEEALDEPETTAVEPASRGVERILVVEDQSALRELVCEMLQEVGYEVLSAADGRAALASSEAFPGSIHLLVTDVVMPGMSGPELLSTLRKRRPGIRALFVSGYTSDIIARSGADGQATDLLQKPFGRDDLLSRVRRALSDARDS